jgi:tetratricopeptide (TPR) repeat protein
MSRESRFAMLLLVVVLPVGVLWAQQPGFPGTLEQLQEVLKRLQAEVKSLQETVKQLSRDAKHNKSSDAVAAPVPTEAAPRQASVWQKAREAYKQGLHLEEQKEYKAAMEAYGQAIDADPKSDAAFLHRGYCAYQLGDNPAAIADYSQSLVVQPNSSRAYLARASAYAAAGNSANALADVNEAIARDSRNPDSFILRASLNQQKGEHQLAVQDYASAAALAPNSDKSYLGRAVVFQADGQPQRALEECEQAVRANPNAAAGYLCRAEAFMKMNATARAVEEINRALVAAQALNQPMPLLNQLAQSIPVAPLSPAAEVAKEQPAPALVAAAPPPIVPQPQPPQPEVAAKPNSQAAGDAQRFHQLGREQNDQQKFEQAIRMLNRAIELDPWLASAYNARGYAYLRMLNYNRAVIDFSEAIRLQPNYANAYINRAVARRHTGDTTGAAADQRKAYGLSAGEQRPGAPKSALSAQR